jgi:hypothetical protein
MPTDIEERLRTELERMSREVAPDPTVPPVVGRRVRRRMAGAVVAAATALAVVVSVSVVSVKLVARGPARVGTAPACSWSAVPSPSEDPSRFDTYLRSVTASGPDDAWAVGIYSEPREGAADHILLQHWDGTQWSVEPSPISGQNGYGPSIFGTTSTAPDDAWAVGLQDTQGGGLPLALHWDGGSWTVADMPDTGYPESHLWATAAIDRDDVWAVGNWARPGVLQGGGLALHWDGTAWADAPVPQAPPVADTGGPYDSLESVSATGGDDVWAVGSSVNVPETASKTLAVHWDGTAWTIVPTPNIAPEPGTGAVDNTLTSVAAIAPDDAWAVGSFEEQGLSLSVPTTSRPLALHWNGTGWLVVSLPDVGQGELDGVAALGPSDVWAVGHTITTAGNDYALHPLLLHWDGTAWSAVDPPLDTDGALSAVTAIPGGGLWAIGNRGSGSPARSLVLRCT